MRDGFKITNETDSLTLSKDNLSMTFDIKIKTPDDGFLLAMRSIPNPIHDNCFEHITMLVKNKDKEPIKIDVNDFHDLIGHTYEERIRKTTEKYNFKLTGTLKECKNCALAKAKRKTILKITEIQETKPEERLSIYLTHPLAKEVNGDRYMLLIVCQFTKYKIVRFLKTKDQMTETMMEVIKLIERSTEHKVKYIRADNEGETWK